MFLKKSRPTKKCIGFRWFNDIKNTRLSDIKCQHFSRRHFTLFIGLWKKKFLRAIKYKTQLWKKSLHSYRLLGPNFLTPFSLLPGKHFDFDMRQQASPEKFSFINIPFAAGNFWLLFSELGIKINEGLLDGGCVIGNISSYYLLLKVHFEVHMNLFEIGFHGHSDSHSRADWDVLF